MATYNGLSTPISWHYDRDVQATVRDFHDSFTRVPEMEREVRMHTNILSIIERELKKDCFGPAAPMIRYEHTGSTRDGVKIGRDGIEFDTMVIIKGGNILTATEQSKPGFYTLKPASSGNNLATITSQNGLLSSDVAKRKFKSRLQRIITSTPDLQQYCIKLVDHGPATQMDIYDDDRSTKLYSVDMVPSFQVGAFYYVAKPFREAGNQAVDVWRISYSLNEKQKFDGLDRYNLCRKQALRVCKAMRVDASELKKITSYHLKNALFYEVDDLPEPNDWRQEKLAARVLGIWGRVERCLNEGHMGSYYNDRMDLLDSIPPMAKSNIRDRIRRFCNNKNTFITMIRRIKAQYISHSSASGATFDGYHSDMGNEETDTWYQTSSTETPTVNESGFSNLAIGVGVGAAIGLGLAALAGIVISRDQSSRR